jgi:hypothetical protein
MSASVPWLLTGLGLLGGVAGCTRPLDGAPTPTPAPVDSGAYRLGIGALCASDSDCGNAFLGCAPTTGTTCRAAGPDAGAGSPPWSYPDNLPICPETATVTFDSCTARYQLPCRADTDCGPAGFTCVHGSSFESPCPGDDSGTAACGICNQEAKGPCSADAECPAGWSCYWPCSCAGQAPVAKGCYPPFAQFNCPSCPGGVVGDGGS